MIRSTADLLAIEAAGLDSFMPHHSLLQALAAVAAVHGARPAITWLPSVEPGDGAQVWTHAELLHRVRQSANLLHSLGVDDSHALAFLLPAMPAAYLALLGGETAGRVCPINYLLEAEHIAELMVASNARVLIALAPCAESDIAAKAARLRALCPQLERVLWVAGDRDDADSFEALIAQQPGERLNFERLVTRDSVAALFHTGGTTGAPKLAQHTHGNQLHTATSAALYCACDERDVIINGFALFHVAGAFVFGLSTLLAGACVLLPTLLGLRNPGLVRRYWQVVEQYRVTLLAAVPTVISALMNTDAADADIHTVRALLTGGSPLPDALAAGFEQRFGIPVRNILGLTECAGVVSIEPFHAPRVPGSCGLRLPFTEVCALADEPAAAEPAPVTVAHDAPDAPESPNAPTDVGSIRRLGAGQTGILALRGPNVGPGYTDARRNAGTFEGQWLVTGDIGHVALDGRIFITGRAKDLIIRSAHNIDPGVIEQALLSHPEVLHAAAVGEPDDYAGELPVAFVALKPGSVLDAEALLRFVAPLIAERPALPKRLTIIESMPMTAIGKVYKPALRLRALEQAFSERLARAGLADEVSVRAEPQARGLALCFTTSGGDADRCAAALAALMAPFALPYRIAAASTPAPVP